MIFGIDRAGPTVEIPEALKGQPIVYVAYNHSGAAEDLERDIAGLRKGPAPVSEAVRQPADYLEVQTAHDLVLGFGHRSFLLGANADDIRAEALDELVELVATAPGEGTFSVDGPAAGRSAACPRTRWPTRVATPRST